MRRRRKRWLVDGDSAVKEVGGLVGRSVVGRAERYYGDCDCGGARQTGPG